MLLPRNRQGIRVKVRHTNAISEGFNSKIQAINADERVFRTVSMSYHPADWGEDSPWMKLFYNARTWVG